MNNLSSRTITGLLAALFAASALFGCAQAPVPKDHYYRLEITTAQPGPKLIDGTVEVHRFQADSLTAGRAIVYSTRDQPNQLLGYHYHFWAESPATMVQHVLVRYLRDNGVATAVTTPELRTEPDYVLHGSIPRLEHITGPGPAAAVALELVLKKVGSNVPTLVRTYQWEAPLQDNSVSSAVIAINQGLMDNFRRFLADLAQITDRTGTNDTAP